VTATVVPGASDSIPEVAGKLIAIAEELGHGPRVVSITHDPGLVFLVPDDVADKYSGVQADEAEAQPKRRRRTHDAEGGEK
jgi:hypothetical protein